MRAPSGSHAVGSLSAELLLAAYARGIFPMKEDGVPHWHDPDPRAIIPLEHLHPNATMRRVIRSGRFHCTIDRDFAGVMRHCADRERTWIDGEMIACYTDLHHLGHAHSVEAWCDEGPAGGVYGVALGGAFFGESMFTRRANAGKVALYHLADHLRSRGFTLFDTQYINDLTRSLGAIEIPRSEFRSRLATASSLPVRF